MGSGGTAPCILNLDTRRRRMVNFRHRPLYTLSLLYSLNRRISRLQSRSGHGSEEKKSLLTPCQESNDGGPPLTLLVTRNELLRIHMSFSYFVKYMSYRKAFGKYVYSTEIWVRVSHYFREKGGRQQERKLWADFDVRCCNTSLRR
jgi:hypothetical protein